MDVSILVAAVFSESGVRQSLKLREAGVTALWVGPAVLAELDAVLERRSPASKGNLALLLDRAGVQISRAPNDDDQAQARAVVAYAPDANVVAEAPAVQVG